MNKIIFRISILTVFVTAAFSFAAAQNSMKLPPKNKTSSKTVFKYPPKATLYRFEVVAGKEAKFAEWMKFLADHHAAVIETLDREKTYFESVFTEKSDGRIYVYWLIFNGTGGNAVESSPLEVDKRHLEYWNECIEKGSRTTFQNEFYLTPLFLGEAVKKHQKTEKE